MARFDVGLDNEFAQAERVIDFIQTFLTLGGSFNGEPFILEQFQKDIIYDMYRQDGEGRRLRRQYVVGLPRKNGKSQLGSALAIYHLVADTTDTNPVVISAAGDKNQAALVFKEAKRMVQASPALSKLLVVQRDRILNPKNNGEYRVVSADAGLQQGLNPSFVVFDELHIFKNADLLDAMRLGQGMRRQPLLLVISTAGYDLDSPLGRLYQYGRQIESGEVEDESFGMTWWGPKDDDVFDWKSPEAWERYNPAWSIMPDPIGVFTSTVAVTHESAFIRYYLNGWTSAESAWLPAGSWELREKPGRQLEPKEEVILGFDGAWSGDSTALVAVSLRDFHVELIALWEKPPGNDNWVTPRHEVRQTIKDAFDFFRVKLMLGDPYRFEELVYELAEEGYPVAEFPTNSVQRIVPACTIFYEGVMTGEISWSNDNELGAALSRHLKNTVVKVDHRGTRITKTPGSPNKIDAAVAAVIAYHAAKTYQEEERARFELLVV